MVFLKGGYTFERSSVNEKVLIARGGSDGRAIAFCFLDKTNAADPRSVLIDLEAIVPSLPKQVLPCRADAVAKLEYSGYSFMLRLRQIDISFM